jgi:hypothetical protein
VEELTHKAMDEIYPSYVLRKSTSEVQDWLTHALSAPEGTPSDFNWLGLAELASANARDTLSTQWASIATQTYEYLASREGQIEGGSFMRSAMMLRAYMITHLGVNRDDPILDVRVIEDWFFDSLELPLDEVKKRLPASSLADLQSKTISELQLLRRLKNRLNVIAVLAGSGSVPVDPRLLEWLSLRSLLP